MNPNKSDEQNGSQPRSQDHSQQGSLQPQSRPSLTPDTPSQNPQAVSMPVVSGSFTPPVTDGAANTHPGGGQQQHQQNNQQQTQAKAAQGQVNSGVNPSLVSANSLPQMAAGSQVLPPENDGKQPVDAMLIVLQWLTYAFWGWTLLALSYLVSSVIASFTSGYSEGSTVIYGIAAVIILLPISYACDLFYSKKEPQKKNGAETIVMVIHAVIFALFGIGSLILAAFSIVQLLTNSSVSANSWLYTALYSALIISVFYAITFLRTLNLAKLPWIKKIYKNIMLGTVGVIVLLGILGPVAQERSTRDDRLIEQNLTDVSREISNYTRDKNSLPSSLSDLSLSGDAKAIVERNLVTYKPEGSVSPSPTATSSNNSSSLSRSSSSRLEYSATLKYQLCVQYKKASRDYGESRSTSSTDYGDDDEYKSYLSSAYNHPAGEVCYKLSTSAY